MAFKKSKTKSSGVNPLIVGVIAFGGGYMLADYLAKQKLKDAITSATAQATSTGNQSALQTAVNIYQQANNAGWINDLQNSGIFSFLKQ